MIASAVLLGTIEREIRPLLSSRAKLRYDPFFIAAGTTISDFFNPEIVLLAVDDPGAAARAKEFCPAITDAPFHEMSIVSAELVKANRNAFIATKISFADNLMGACQKMRGQGAGAGAGAATNALSDCRRRIIRGCS